MQAYQMTPLRYNPHSLFSFARSDSSGYFRRFFFEFTCTGSGRDVPQFLRSPIVWSKLATVVVFLVLVTVTLNFEQTPSFV